MTEKCPEEKGVGEEANAGARSAEAVEAARQYESAGSAQTEEATTFKGGEQEQSAPTCSEHIEPPWESSGAKMSFSILFKSPLQENNAFTIAITTSKCSFV